MPDTGHRKGTRKIPQPAEHALAGHRGVHYLFLIQGAHRRMFDGGGGGDLESGRGKVAPYAPWPSCRAVLGRLRAAGGLPDALQRKDLDGLFGATVAKQVLAAFRFMGLIDEARRPTQRMRDLVAACDTPRWPSALADVLRRSFPEITGRDLTHATREQLDVAFGAYRGSSEDVRKKCVRFFLSAAREAEIPLSAELSGPLRSAVDMGPRLAAADVQPPQENGARELFPSLPPASPTVVPLPQAQKPVETAHASEPQRSADYYRTGFTAISPYWNPGEMPEDVEAAIVTVLRYFRKKEAEATKA